MLVAAVLVAAATAVPASAHSTSPDIRLRLDPLPPELEGVTVQVVRTVAPQLLLANPTDTLLEVLSEDGRPFLRISADGVTADVGTRDWYRTNDPLGDTALPVEVRQGDRAADWQAVTDDPSWGWYDHRLHPVALQPSPAVAAAGVPTPIGTWSVPVRIGGVESALTGTIEYQPIRGSFSHRLVLDTEVEELDVQLLPGRVPGLFLANRTGTTVVVLGADDEPFLRFDDGVEANERSPTWVATSRAEGTTPDIAADPAAPPRWRVLADRPQFGWVELRGAFPAEEPEDDLIRLGISVEVARWQVPLEVGGRRVTVEGITTWTPTVDAEVRASGGVQPRILAAVAMGLVLLGAWGHRVRSRRRPGASASAGR
ncbi:hypothetical protein BH23ACT9_BH23ACT9_08270 [soil metagenome]